MIHKRTRRFAAFAMLLAILASQTLASLPSVAQAVEIDGITVLVGKSDILGSVGGTPANYTYDPLTDTYYVGIFGATQGLRRVFRDNPGDPWQTDVYVESSTGSTPSDMLRFIRSSDVSGGLVDADDAGSSTMGGMLLNPTALTFKVDAPANYNESMGYGPVDGNGQISVTYAPGTLAFINDGGLPVEDSSNGDQIRFDWTKKFYRWDLREIGSATSVQPDYDTGTSGDPGNPNPGGLFGAYGQTDWNDALSVVLTEAALRDAYFAAGSPGGTLEADNSDDNLLRQFAWSSDGQSIYAVDSGTIVGGIYKVSATQGTAQLLYAEPGGGNMIAEPTVVNTSVLDFGAGAGAGDQILFDGGPLNGNPGGISYIVDNGTSASGPVALFHGARYAAQMPFGNDDGRVMALTSDSTGNVYYYDAEAFGIFRLDEYGRISNIMSQSESYEVAHSEDGNRSSGGGFLRLQTREDVTGTYVTYRGDNSFIAAVQVFDPADINKDGLRTQADRDMFIAQHRKTLLGDVPVIDNGNMQPFLDYLAADISGDATTNSTDTGLERPAVDNMDTLLFFQHLNQQAGDLNLDGEVTQAEIDAVTGNLGIQGSWFQGDFNRDGAVTQADVDMIAGTGVYDIDAVEPVANYTGGATGDWTDVQKPSGAGPDSDSLITIDRAAGATITGPDGHTLAGTLTLGSHTGASAVDLALQAGSQLDLALGGTIRANGVLSGSPDSVVKLGIPGYGATLVVEDGGSLTGGFTVQGSVSFHNSADTTLNVKVVDSDTPSSLAKHDGGVLTISAPLSYSGKTAIYDGALRQAAVNTLSPHSAVSLEQGSATLDLNGLDAEIGSLASGSDGGSVMLGAGTLTTGGDNSNTQFYGVISGSGGLVKEGTGYLRLRGNSTFSGGTVVNEGTLAVYQTNNALPTDGAVEVNAGGLLDIYRSDQEVAGLSGDGEITNSHGSIASELTVNQPAASTSTFAGSMTGDDLGLTKSGAGTLVLTGDSTYNGGTQINAGTLQVSKNSSLGAETSAVNIAAGGTLLASGSLINRQVNGAVGSQLTAAGPLLVGNPASPSGFNFGGTVNAGSHLVGLIDADQAELHGATIAGGAISSLTSIQMQPSDVGNQQTWITGYGAINGAFTAGVSGNPSQAIVAGDAANGGIEMPGVVNGNGLWINVQHTGLFTSGFSPAYTPVGGNGSQTGASIIEIFGPNAGSLSGTIGVPGDFDQFYVFGMQNGDGTPYTGYLLDGTLDITLDGYSPVLGDSFQIFETGTFELGPFTYGEGMIAYGSGFQINFANAPLNGGLQWGVDATSSGLTLNVQAVPEPSTIVLLLLGSLGMIVAWRRRKITTT